MSRNILSFREPSCTPTRKALLARSAMFNITGRGIAGMSSPPYHPTYPGEDDTPPSSPPLLPSTSPNLQSFSSSHQPDISFISPRARLNAGDAGDMPKDFMSTSEPPSSRARCRYAISWSRVGGCGGHVWMILKRFRVEAKSPNHSALEPAAGGRVYPHVPQNSHAIWSR